MTSPSPRPWRWRDGHTGIELWDTNNVMVVPEKTNADFLVHCVNLHDELVEALGGCCGLLCERADPSRGACKSTMEKARALLAKAKTTD